jgi:surface protein
MALSARLLRPRADSRAEFPHNPQNLVLVYDTSKEPANLQVSVPINTLSVAPNVTIDWGDGSSESHTTTGFKTHTYAAAGIYIVQISGSMTALNYGAGASTTNNKAKLVRCLSFGALGLISLDSAFRNCVNLIQCPTSLPTTSTVTSFLNLFNGCASFNDARCVAWNTSGVTNMINVFLNASAFNQPIGSWNTSSAVNMNGTFRSAVSFNQNIGEWSTASVTDMGFMFNSASSFNNGGSGSIGNWTVSNVIDFGAMFAGASSFNQPIGNWSTGSAVFFSRFSSGMFDGATAFNQDISGWNSSRVIDMSRMFFGTGHAFAQDISGWDIRKVTNMAAMFASTNNNWGTANYDAALEDWADLADTDLTIGTTANTSQAITAFATLSAGTQTRVTSNGHGMVAGSRVNISGTTNYNGDYNVLAATANTFDIAQAFVANDATGTMKHRRSRNVTAGFGSNKYSAGTPTTKRGVLTGDYSWSITDGGQV